MPPLSKISELFDAAHGALREINVFASLLNIFLHNLVIERHKDIMAMLESAMKIVLGDSFAEKYKSEDTKNDVIAEMLNLINDQHPEIISDLIRNNASQIAGDMAEVMEIDANAPFKITTSLLYFIGLLKSIFLAKDPSALILLKSFELSPELLALFHKSYQLRGNAGLNQWAASVADLNKALPDISTVPNTVLDEFIRVIPVNDPVKRLAFFRYLYTISNI